MGDYVLVHVGFAISRIDEAEAQETLELLGSKSPKASPTDSVNCLIPLRPRRRSRRTSPIPDP